MAASSTPRILQLAEKITAAVAQIQEVLQAKGLSSPSFEEDAPLTLPQELSEAQDAVLDATAELRDLLTDPMIMIHGHGGHNNALSQQAIARYGIAAMVPVGGRVSFADIAAKTPLPEQMIARLLRHAITMHIFYEPEPGFVAHTKASKILVDHIGNDWLGAGTEEMWPASTKVLDALEKWPRSEEINETGFTLANNTAESIYAYLGSHPKRAARFGNAMAAYLKKPEHNPAYITDYFDWASLGEAKVVQIGGGQGQFAIALAKRHSNLRVVVQDMAFMFGPAEAGIPEELKGKVTFQPHDFFAPQSTEAAVYYFRWNLRVWSDKYCLLALRAQIPKLKPGARVIIQEVILPEPGTGPQWREKHARSGDLTVAACFNSRERTVTEWKILLQQADIGFVFESIVTPKGSDLAILVFSWAVKE